jgi:hypothetical protein
LCTAGRYRGAQSGLWWRRQRDLCAAGNAATGEPEHDAHNTTKALASALHLTGARAAVELRTLGLEDRKLPFAFVFDFVNKMGVCRLLLLGQRRAVVHAVLGAHMQLHAVAALLPLALLASTHGGRQRLDEKVLDQVWVGLVGCHKLGLCVQLRRGSPWWLGLGRPRRGVLPRRGCCRWNGRQRGWAWQARGGRVKRARRGTKRVRTVSSCDAGLLRRGGGRGRGHDGRQQRDRRGAMHFAHMSVADGSGCDGGSLRGVPSPAQTIKFVRTHHNDILESE